MDFKSIILTTLSDNVPELEGKIQAGAVDEKTAAPFATFTTPEEKPLRTLSGVAGYETTFELTVYHSRVAGAEELKRKVVRALDDLLQRSDLRVGDERDAARRYNGLLARLRPREFTRRRGNLKLAAARQDSFIATLLEF